MESGCSFCGDILEILRNFPNLWFIYFFPNIALIQIKRLVRKKYGALSFSRNVKNFEKKKAFSLDFVSIDRNVAQGQENLAI